MFKIASGILAIALVLGVVGAVAYANFSASATVNGLGLTAGTPGLQVSNDSATGFSTTITVPTAPTNVKPGTPVTQTFYVMNTSTYTGSIMDLHAQINSGATGNWDALKDVVKVKFSDGATTSAEHTLNEWFTNGYPLNISVAKQNPAASKLITVTLTLDSSVTNSAAGQNVLTNWTITGDEASASASPSASPTATPVPTVAPTATPTPSATPTPTASPTSTPVPTATP